MGGIGGSRARLDTDPYDDGTETSHLFFSWWPIGKEAGRNDGGPSNLPSVDEIMNLWKDSVPDTSERRVKDSMDRLDRDMSPSADGLRERSGE